MLGNSGALGGPGRWEHVRGSPPRSLGEWVGGSERVRRVQRTRGREGGRERAGWGVRWEGRGPRARQEVSGSGEGPKRSQALT